jgi:hypothetical protein
MRPFRNSKSRLFQEDPRKRLKMSNLDKRSRKSTELFEMVARECN